MKKNDKGEIYDFCMRQSCCKVCPKLERCPFEENNKISNTKKNEQSNNKGNNKTKEIKVQ